MFSCFIKNNKFSLCSFPADNSRMPEWIALKNVPVLCDMIQKKMKSNIFCQDAEVFKWVGSYLHINEVKKHNLII